MYKHLFAKLIAFAKLCPITGRLIIFAILIHHTDLMGKKQYIILTVSSAKLNADIQENWMTMNDKRWGGAVISIPIHHLRARSPKLMDMEASSADRAATWSLEFCLPVRQRLFHSISKDRLFSFCQLQICRCYFLMFCKALAQDLWRTTWS